MEHLAFDEVLRKYVGEFGRYQLGVCLLLALGAVTNAFYIMDIVFIAAQPPDYWCDIIHGEPGVSLLNTSLTHDSSPWTSLNASLDQWRALISPVSDGELRKPDQCFAFADAERHIRETVATGNISAVINEIQAHPVDSLPTVACSKWHYRPAQFEDTLVKQWSLICDRRWLIASANSAFLAGTLIGAIGGGVFADRFGRWKVLVTFSTIAIACRLGMAFSPNISLFILFRFMIGLTNLDTYTAAFVLGTELVGPTWRVFFSTMQCMVWAVGYMLLPGIVYALRGKSWMTLTLALTGCCSYVFVYFFLIPESPRWQLSIGQKEAAMNTLKRMAQVNGRQLPDGLIIHAAMEKTTKSKCLPLLKLIRSSVVGWRTVIVSCVWITASLVYYGLSLGVGDLFGSLYLNTSIMGAVEIPGYFMGKVLLNSRLGRRGTLAFLFGWCGISLLCTNFVSKETKIVTTVLAMLGKLGISGAFMGAYVITAELSPTSLRQVILGLMATLGRIGGTVAPFVGHLASYHSAIPPTVFGITALAAGTSIMFLPETRGRPLPSSFKDVDVVSRETALCRGTCFGKEDETPETDTEATTSML